MHMPKGSNNRLNEKSANRANGNRLFDSQNNNRGGYNVGDMHKTNGFTANDGYATDDQMYNYANTDPLENGNDGKVQFEESFLEGSVLRQTHTVQHGCGNIKNNCNIVLEYTCDSHDQEDNNLLNANNNDYDFSGLRVQLKNGLNTGTSADPGNINNVKNTITTNRNNNRGIHESEEYYAYGKQRGRNQGLFTADQKLQGNAQIYTRQNPGGTRRGLELPEERDYFPWWNPSIWRPLVIWHNDLAECEKEMALKSQAVEEKWHCIPTGTQFNNGNTANDIVKAETKAACDAAGGTWKSHKFDMPKPKCVKANWSQVNNLGNVENTEGGGLPRYYDLTLPTIAELEKAGCHIYTINTDNNSLNKKKARLVFRTRYNMTTADYAPYNTDSNCNQDANSEIQSPVTQNPTVDVGFKMQGLRLAINTAQTGRTFQDRSHVVAVVERAGALVGKKILNVNVQGKRGNIVQTFPAVEYDFWPRKAEVKVGECMAFMWTGSNTHNNGNPAGDGQAGDAGEGRGGSDRSNMIQLLDKQETYPMPLDLDPLKIDMLAQSDCYQSIGGAAWGSGTLGGNVEQKDAQLYLLSGGYFNTFAELDTKDEMDPLLDNVSATMRSITCCPKQSGQYWFTSTRNNNFSNRDQKLEVVVSDP